MHLDWDYSTDVQGFGLVTPAHCWQWSRVLGTIETSGKDHFLIDKSFNTFLLRESRGGEHKLCFPFPFHFYLNKNVALNRNSWKSRNLLLVFYYIILCLSSQSYMVLKGNMKRTIEIQPGRAGGVPSYPSSQTLLTLGRA